jgi:hypothetical protein
MKIGRNAPCPCGSGRKYKHCCLEKQQGMSVYQKLLIGFIALICVGGLIQVFASFRALEPGTVRQQGGQVWSEEHQHWH